MANRSFTFRWFQYGFVAGSVTSVALYSRYWITGSMFGEIELWLWPSSILLMANEFAGSGTETIIVSLISILINAVLYGIVFAGIAVLLRLFRQVRG